MPFRKVRNGGSPWFSPLVGSVAYAVGVKSGTTITVGVQLKDSGSRGGANVAQRVKVDWYLTTDANGDTPSTAASGGVTQGARGTVTSVVAGKSGFATTNATGGLDIAITDAGPRNLYLILVIAGQLYPTPVLAF